MEHVQSAILVLQQALQRRSCCDAETQTDHDEVDNISMMKHHINMAHWYLKKHDELPSPNCANLMAEWGKKTPRDEDELTENSSIGCSVSSAIHNEEYSEQRKRKKRKRDSGASDDESFVMERHNRVYLAYKPEDKSWKFKYVLKEKNETWDEADSAILRKMSDVTVQGKCPHNAFTEREKLVQLWCDQNKVDYSVGDTAVKNMTNLELFVAIKKSSPKLIRSGIPNQTVESEAL